MDDHLIFDTDAEGRPPRAAGRPEAAASPECGSLSGLLDTLDHLKGEFEQRLTGIVRTETAMAESAAGAASLITLELLRPFADAMQSMGRVQDESEVSAVAEPARSASHKKRFLTDGVDVVLGAFQEPVVLRAYLAPQRPDRPE